MDGMPVGVKNRPPFESFTKPTCRGSFALGTACGHCERCTWERSRPLNSIDEVSLHVDAKPKEPLSIEPGASTLDILQLILGTLIYCPHCCSQVGYRWNPKQRQLFCTRASHPIVSFAV